MQTNKIDHFPVVLIGTAYWAGLLRWLRARVAAEGKIDPSDVDLLTVTDNVDEAVALMVASRARLGAARTGNG